MHQPIAGIACCYQFLELGICVGIGLRVGHHLLDVLLAQPARCGDADRLLLTGCLVLGRHMQNTIGIKVKRYLDLRHAALRRGNICKVEPSQRLIARGLLALALDDMNGHRRLVVLVRRKHL